MLKYAVCVVYIIFSVSGLTLVKMGSLHSDKVFFTVPIIDVPINLWSLGGVVCYGISFLLYLGVITKFDLGVINPLLGGIVNILIVVMAFFVLKENLTINMLVGAFVVTVGIVIMNIGR